MSAQPTYREHMAFEGMDPVSRRPRLLEVVTAPTGEAARFFAATQGNGSAWLSREEVESLMRFFREWLDRTDPSDSP